jgi:hypothetical protein
MGLEHIKKCQEDGPQGRGYSGYSFIQKRSGSV